MLTSAKNKNKNKNKKKMWGLRTVQMLVPLTDLPTVDRKTDLVTFLVLFIV